MHSLSLDKGRKCSFWPTRVSARNFFRRHFEQGKCSLPYLLFVWHTVFSNLFQMAACVYTQWSNVSDKQTEPSFNLHKLSKSGLCNSKLCAIHIWEHTKVLWPCLGAFCYQHAFKVHMLCYDLYSIIANFATGFSWISRIGTEPNFKYWFLQPHLFVKNLGNIALVHQGVFYQVLLLTSVVPDPDYWSPIRQNYDICLDPEWDWISFLLKPDPDPDYQKRFQNFLIFLRFVFFLRKFSW